MDLAVFGTATFMSSWTIKAARAKVRQWNRLELATSRVKKLVHNGRACYVDPWTICVGSQLRMGVQTGVGR
jgi:hypothetical protein